MPDEYPQGKPCHPRHLARPDRVILCYDHYKGGVVVEVSDTRVIGGVVWQAEDVGDGARCVRGNPRPGAIRARRLRHGRDDDRVAGAADGPAPPAADTAVVGAGAGASGPEDPEESQAQASRFGDDSLLAPSCYWVGGQLICC